MKAIWEACVDALFPLRRDIVSTGLADAHHWIAARTPGYVIHSYASGTRAWDWTVPQAWQLRSAWIENDHGDRLLDTATDHPLSVMSYSQPIRLTLTAEELDPHLHSRPDAPDAVPFEFSYYEPRWGFCIPHKDRLRYSTGLYRVSIDAEFSDSTCLVGEILLPGSEPSEVVLVAHLCHPYQANDNLTGVAVLLSLASELQQTRHRHGYRILLVPETIGSIAYLSRHEDALPLMTAGVCLDMLGYGPLNIQHSPYNSGIDAAARALAVDGGIRLLRYREGIGNDDRVFNSIGVGVPMVGVNRGGIWRQGEQPFGGYHTSADTPERVDVRALEDARDAVLRLLLAYDTDFYPRARVRGPVHLSSHGLWCDWRSNRALNLAQADVLDMLDGTHSVCEIAHTTGVPFGTLCRWLETMLSEGVIDAQY